VPKQYIESTIKIREQKTSCSRIFYILRLVWIKKLEFSSD
jgi:hypothetical protein